MTESPPQKPANVDRSAHIDALKAASVRANTDTTYRQALRHYELTYGGTLPATPAMIEGYIDFCAREEAHSVNTISTRLAALSVFHRDQGYPNPVRTPTVNKTLKGLRSRYGRAPVKATPITLQELTALVLALETQIRAADSKEASKATRALALQGLRDRAFFLVGFWFGYRSDELVRLRLEDCMISHDRQTMTCYLPYTKGDREAQGDSKIRSALDTTAYASLCPIAALQDWIAVCGANTGWVFTGISRWGVINDRPLHVDSVVRLMRKALARAELEDSDRFSSHSLRRGFAHWVVDQGGEVAALMTLVGWRDPKTAVSYVKDTPATFDRLLKSVQTENQSTNGTPKVIKREED